MTPVPETYFSRHIRASQTALSAAPDVIGQAAQAQLAAAYQILAGAAETLPSSPIFSVSEGLDRSRPLYPPPSSRIKCGADITDNGIHIVVPTSTSDPE